MIAEAQQKAEAGAEAGAEARGTSRCQQLSQLRLTFFSLLIASFIRRTALRKIAATMTVTADSSSQKVSLSKGEEEQQSNKNHVTIPSNVQI